MKSRLNLVLHTPLARNSIFVALAAATLPLMLLPGCYDSGYAHFNPLIRTDFAHPTPAAQTASTTCPAMVFQTTQQIADNTAGEEFGAQRQSDGSFTEYVFTHSDLNSTKTATIPNVQQLLVNCAGIGSRPRKSLTPSNGFPLGVASRNPLWADLAGDGGGALIGYAETLDIDAVLVQRSAPGVIPRGSVGVYPAATGVVGLLAADFNGDGKLDVVAVYTGASATASAPGGVAILLGNGDATLKPAIKYSTSANALSMTIADFNGDGRPDIAVGHYGGIVKILLDNADGSLAAGAQYAMPSSEVSVNSLASADLNGDHIADLMVQTNGGVHILFGKGDGTFTTGPVLASTAGYGIVAAGDFNLDGIADIAVTASNTSGVLVYLGTGTGNFAAPVQYATNFGANGSGMAQLWVEDFDGDGFPDLVFGSGHPDDLTPTQDSSAIGVLFGNGDGTFAGANNYKIDSDTVYTQQAPAATGTVIADFNGDGKPDVATSSATGKTIAITLANSSGGFKNPALVSMGSVQPTSIAAGALSSDGKSDLIVTDGASNVYVFFHNGDGTFQQPIKYPSGGNGANFVVTGDFNGDKKLDLAVVNSTSNTVAVLPGFGDSSFNNPIVTTVGTNPVGVFAGDFNGDGKLDLAVANGGTFSASGTNLGSVSILLGKGDGTFQPAVNYTAYQYPTFITAADVNGDGKLDLLVASKGAGGVDQIAMLAGNGNGTFQNAAAIATSPGPVWIAAADFSGDGKLDLAVSHCCQSGVLAVMQGNGNGTFQPEISLGQGSFSSLAAADFNADGKSDLAFTAYVAGFGRQLTIYRNITVSRGLLTLSTSAGNPLKGPPVAAYSIATARGSDLATGIQTNTSVTLPTNMQGTTISVQDSTGVSLPAQQFYVSPTQVNFLIPQGIATGTATVTITSGDGFISSGTVAIAKVAPAIYTLNSNNLAAAYVQRVHGDGSQSIENLYAVDAAGNVSFPPIDLGPSTDQVYINIFGTGVQARSSLSNVQITVGGVSVPALYAAASTYPGEDQIAILLPRSLAGSGTVNVLITVDGSAANNTNLNIK